MAQRVQIIILQLIKPLSQMPIKKKSFLEPLLEAITLLFTINFIQLELILDKLLYSFIKFFKINILFQIAATLKIKILKKSRSKLFIVRGRKDLLKSVFTVLIIVGFFLMAVRRAQCISFIANFAWAVKAVNTLRVTWFKAAL